MALFDVSKIRIEYCSYENCGIFIRYSTYSHQISSTLPSDADSMIRDAAFLCIRVQFDSFLRMEGNLLRINRPHIRMEGNLLRIKRPHIRVKGICLRIKILQNELFTSPKCYTLRMISLHLSTMIVADKYQKSLIPEISKVVYTRENIYLSCTKR